MMLFFAVCCSFHRHSVFSFVCRLRAGSANDFEFRPICILFIFELSVSYFSSESRLIFILRPFLCSSVSFRCIFTVFLFCHRLKNTLSFFFGHSLLPVAFCYSRLFVSAFVRFVISISYWSSLQCFSASSCFVRLSSNSETDAASCWILFENCSIRKFWSFLL